MDASEKPDIGVVLEYYHGTPIPTGFYGRAKVRCFYHDDSHASASVDHNKNTYKCFACDASGDSFTIIMREEGDADFATAKRYAQERGWIVDGDVSGATEAVSRSNGLSNGAGAKRGHNRGRQARVRRKRRRS